MRQAVIVDAVRSPKGRGKAGGSLSAIHPADLQAGVFKGHFARDDEVLRAAHHALRGEVDRLLARPALAVDRDRRDVLGEARREPAHPADRGLLADLRDTADDHVVDEVRVDARALDDRADDVRAEVGGVPPGQRAAAPADRGADRVEEEGFGHGSS